MGQWGPNWLIKELRDCVNMPAAFLPVVEEQRAALIGVRGWELGSLVSSFLSVECYDAVEILFVAGRRIKEMACRGS
jgi:hypothetical protein